MRIELRNELWLINILAILLIAILSFFPLDALRIALGLPFGLFFPGYTLIAALFPKKTGLGAVERVALSVVVSVSVVSLMGFILNYTPFGITLYSVLFSVTIFIVVTSIVAWYRRRRLPEEQRFGIAFSLSIPQWTVMKAWQRAFVVLLIISILSATGVLGYTIATPRMGEKFTEFYILGLEGKAEDYPYEVMRGEEVNLILEIINHEHERVNYRVDIRIDGVQSSKIGPVVLDHEEAWEQEVSLVPHRIGENQKAEFWLFKEGDAEPYRSLHLWLNVNEK